MPVRLDDGDELVALVERERADAVVAEIAERRDLQTLDRAVARGHEEVLLLLRLLTEVQHRLHALARLDLNDVHDVHALGRLAALGDLIALLAVDLARVGEEEDIVVRRGGEHVDHRVLLAGGDALLAHAALTLGGILARGGALDVAVGRERKDALLLLDQILDVDLILDVLNLGAALVAELVGDGGQLLLEDLAHERVVGEHLEEVGDLLLELLVLVLQLLAVEPLQALELHVEDGLRLHVVE